MVMGGVGCIDHKNRWEGNASSVFKTTHNTDVVKINSITLTSYNTTILKS
jgi:hypothetical protein